FEPHCHPDLGQRSCAGGAQHRGFPCPVICDFASPLFSQVSRPRLHLRIPSPPSSIKLLLWKPPPRSLPPVSRRITFACILKLKLPPIIDHVSDVAVMRPPWAFQLPS